MLFSCGCYCTARIVQRPAPPPAGSGNTPAAPALIRDIVALLADPETGHVGRAIVSVPVGGPVELHDKRTGIRVVAGYRPSVVFRLSEDQVQQLFGEALAARPPAPRHFLLYFADGSTRLTRESERLLTEILAFVKSRSVPDVTVVGHTDTTGGARANIELGLIEATLIRDRLVAAGLDIGLVSVASHGEADLLVPTPDNTANPKNRRVDVTVR
jgi:outer membrane protein OmpA-like peptidoglycan-associated protein